LSNAALKLFPRRAARRRQIDVPSRAEAIRRMVELAINAKRKPDIDR